MNASGQPPRLLVIDSIRPAIDRTQAMLFGPVLLGMWLRFGFLAFLEGLVRGGSTTQINFPGTGGPPADMGESFQEVLDESLAFLAAYALIIVAVLVLLAALGIGLRYLGCRAEVSFAYACAAGTPSLRADWRRTRSAGNSLFGFHLILLGLAFAMLLVFGLLIAAAILNRHEMAAALPWLVAAGLFAVFGTMAFGLVDSLTRQFVTPIMVRDEQGWRAAWGKVGPVLLANWFPLAGYYLLKVAFWITVGIATMLVGCATLCIGLLPIVHHALFAPVYVFERNWSMVMLHYLGPDFEVFHAAEAEPEPASDAPWAPVRDDEP